MLVHRSNTVCCLLVVVVVVVVPAVKSTNANDNKTGCGMGFLDRWRGLKRVLGV